MLPRGETDISFFLSATEFSLMILAEKISAPIKDMQLSILRMLHLLARESSMRQCN